MSNFKKLAVLLNNHTYIPSLILSGVSFALGYFFSFAVFLVFGSIFLIDAIVLFFYKLKFNKSPSILSWKNSCIMYSYILLGLGIYGNPFIGGDDAIKDRTQVGGSDFYIIYLSVALAVFINGIINHLQTQKAQKEHTGSMSNLDGLF